MNSIRYRLEPWLIWNIVSSLGWSVGLLAASALGALSGLEAPPEVRLLLVGGLAGALGGLALRLIAPPHSDLGSRWLFARMVGAALGVFASGVSVALVGGRWGWPLGGALGGLIFGLTRLPWQQPHNIARQAGRTLANAAGWGLAHTVGAALAPIQPSNAPLAAALGWAVLGMLGVMSVLALSPPRLAREQRVRILGLP